jgi:RNA polymerase sigma factor (sigma-70 family)
MSPEAADRLITELFDSSYHLFVRYSFRVLHDWTVAEDVVQQALMFLYRDLRQGAMIDQPKAWTFCVIRRLIGKYLHAHQRETALHAPLSVLDDFPTQVLSTTDAALEMNDVDKLFSILTPRERDVVALRMTSLKYREIGERLGISPKSVNTLLARALRKLQIAASTKSTQDSESKYVESIATKTLHG